MSIFNCLAPCCEPPPPPECCLTLDELSTLFPSGLTINFGTGPINISNSAWTTFSPCCLSTSIAVPSTPPQENCSSIWSYSASEQFRIRRMVREFLSISASGTEPTPCAETCPEPDLVEDFRNDVLIQEQGEYVFATQLRLTSIDIVLGKTFQTCSYGTPVCVYTIAITFNYNYFIAAQRATRYYMQDVGTDILKRCGDDSYTQETLSDADFPLCNYVTLPEVPTGSWSVTRTKVLTTLTSPQVFSQDDPSPEWCDLPGACGAYTTDQQLELCIESADTRPVYAQRTKASYSSEIGCYFEYNFTDTENPEESRCYTVYADSNRLYTLETLEPPTPPGIPLDMALTIASPKSLVQCEWLCSADPLALAQDCRSDPFGVILPFGAKYLPIGDLIDLLSFSYTSTQATLPVCHTYESPNWTLTF